jgi:hypothetical protein
LEDVFALKVRIVVEDILKCSACGHPPANDVPDGYSHPADAGFATHD